MAGASFCPACGEVVSDGCPELDDEGNELPIESYTPCRCETGIDSNNRIVDWDKAKAWFRGREPDAVRYGIVAEGDDSEDVLRWIPYEVEDHAHESRKQADKRNPYHSPHRVVKATITLEDIEP